MKLLRVLGSRGFTHRVVLIGVAVTAAVALAGSVGAAPMPGGLVVQTGQAGGFSVPVPSGWRYKNASYPSDHSTEFWTDPTNAKSKLEVQVSGCIGCVERNSCVLHNTGCGPYPEGLVPKGTISKRKLSPWREQFTAKNSASPYLDRGLVVIQHQGSKIEDWAYVEIWVPASEASTASSMLAGFKFG